MAISPTFMLTKKEWVIPIDIASAMVWTDKKPSIDKKNIFFSLSSSVFVWSFCSEINERIGVNIIVNNTTQKPTISINLGQIVDIIHGAAIKIAFHKAYPDMILKKVNLCDLKNSLFLSIRADIDTTANDIIVEMKRAVIILFLVIC